MLELYHNDMAVCAAKVRLVLSEKGLPWTGHHLDLSAGETRSASYLKLNPAGVVPTLVDDGEVIVESTVICEYLDDKWPSRALKPAKPAHRARMRLWTKQLDEGVHAATGAITYCIAFREAHLDKSPEELAAFLANIPSPDQRERVASAVRLGMDAPQFGASLKRFSKLFHDMAGALERGPWLAGYDYSLADIAFTPYMTRLEHLGLEQLFHEHGRVADWAQRLKERPAYRPAIADWFNPRTLETMERTRHSVRNKLRSLLAVSKQ